MYLHSHSVEPWDVHPVIADKAYSCIYLLSTECMHFIRKAAKFAWCVIVQNFIYESLIENSEHPSPYTKAHLTP